MREGPEWMAGLDQGEMSMGAMRTMLDPAWRWSRDELEAYYTQGSCHVLAVALQSLTGLPMGVMWNPFDWQIAPDENGQGGVLELVHVYVIEPDGKVLDIKGSRTEAEMKRDMADDWEACPCEELDQELLISLIEDSGNLIRFGDEEVDEAIEVIRRDPALSKAVRRYRPDWEADGSPPAPRPF